MNNIPTSPNDPVNTDILLVAEDRIKGFRRLPFHAISEQCGHPVPVVIQRLKAMMEAGVVRRVRQTLLATKLAQGALVAWSLPEEKLDAAFDWMKELDPFTGHVVLRNTDAANPGANYRLWTTVKVPVGCGTLEERIDEMLRSKQQMTDEILGQKQEGGLLTELSDKELIEFVSLDVRSCEI